MEKQVSEGEPTATQQLAAQPKEKINIYMQSEEKARLEAAKASGEQVEWPYHVVQINGHKFQIQKGVDAEVPKTVADILREAGLI